MRFEELLEKHGIPTAPSNHRHTRPGWLNVDCPWCGPDSQRFHLGYHINGGFLHCWRCGRHQVHDYLGHVLNVSKQELTKTLKSIEIDKHFIAEVKPIGSYKPPSGVGELRKQHKDYLVYRGFDPAEIEDVWRVRGIGIGPPRFSWRLFIPIFDKGTNPVSWTTRSIGKNVDQRYITARPDQEIKSPKKLLYGWQYVTHSVVICEGPLDAWAIGPGGVATLGLMVTPAQIAIMATCPRRTLCFDRESAAQKRAEAIADILSIYPGETNIVEVDGKDAASSPKENIQQIRKHFLT
jgi:hypothetical protein